ncbi:DUF2461 domain-containing protein [Melioribacter sp. OK-6-Me]|uniref:DUF2461 domain-containing protein n=1 Tax=unclassified Melioribacter TaxID=2627329 RepID=UPI003EDADF07
MTDINYMSKFPTAPLAFLKKLKKNNNRNWFEEHRREYEEDFLKPAQAFVEIMSMHLIEIKPSFQAVPKIDKSIFRIHRDVRFSKDKKPYKTNLGILFWEGKGKKIESSGLYFHVDPESFFIAVGIYEFTKEQLKRYRDVVAVETNARQLNKILSSIKKKGYTIGGKSYKQVPRGYDKNYKFSELLLYGSIYAFYEEDVNFLDGKDPVKLSINTLIDLLPLHNWLIENIC